MDNANYVVIMKDLMGNTIVFYKHVLQDKGSLFKVRVSTVLIGNEANSQIDSVVQTNVLEINIF